MDDRMNGALIGILAHHTFMVAAWRSGNVVGRINEVTLRRARLVPGTGMGDRLRQTNHLSISPSHPGQLSLLPSAGRAMSASQSAVMLCGWGVGSKGRYGSFHLWINVCMGGR